MPVVRVRASRLHHAPFSPADASSVGYCDVAGVTILPQLRGGGQIGVGGGLQHPWGEEDEQILAALESDVVLEQPANDRNAVEPGHAGGVVVGRVAIDAAQDDRLAV